MFWLSGVQGNLRVEDSHEASLACYSTQDRQWHQAATSSTALQHQAHVWRCERLCTHLQYPCMHDGRSTVDNLA